METLRVVSLEGNWDPAINSRRLEAAAAAFIQLQADFIIVSGTYEPRASDGPGVPKLGERNAHALRHDHDIDAALIIPAHAFPFEFTYTTIEAFGNACAIGWLASGFERRSTALRVDFAPISSGIHSRRVHALNLRACQALTQFNVDANVREQPAELDEPQMMESEARKLAAITSADGVIATGHWLHGRDEWCLDDPKHMRTMMTRLVETVLSGWEQNQIRDIVGASSLPRRHALMQVLCEISTQGALGSLKLDRILARTARRFPTTFDERDAPDLASLVGRRRGNEDR